MGQLTGFCRADVYTPGGQKVEEIEGWINGYKIRFFAAANTGDSRWELIDVYIPGEGMWQIGVSQAGANPTIYVATPELPTTYVFNDGYGLYGSTTIRVSGTIGGLPGATEVYFAAYNRNSQHIGTSHFTYNNGYHDTYITTSSPLSYGPINVYISLGGGA